MQRGKEALRQRGRKTEKQKQSWDMEAEGGAQAEAGRWIGRPRQAGAKVEADAEAQGETVIEAHAGVRGFPYRGRGKGNRGKEHMCRQRSSNPYSRPRTANPHDTNPHKQKSRAKKFGDFPLSGGHIPLKRRTGWGRTPGMSNMLPIGCKLTVAFDAAS